MIPEMHDRVRLHDSDETFVVVGVDYGRRLADLISADGDGTVIGDVPFEQLQGSALAGAGPEVSRGSMP